MLYFLTMKGPEMHLFGIARLKLMTYQYPFPVPIVKYWVVLHEEEHNFMFHQFCLRL